MIGRAQERIALGLKAVQAEVLGYAGDSYLKLRAMQEAYLLRTSIEYLPDEKAAIRYYLDALIHKFHMATLALEQLWALSYDKRGEILEAIELSLDRLTVSEDELATMSFAFDTFLYHSRTYIDFYMLYICYVLKTGHEGSISQSKFQKALETVSEVELAAKATRVRNYLETSVYGPYDGKSFVVSNWGTLITSIRDKVAHRDVIRPSFESNETLLRQILFDWPTIRGVTYERFHQDMHNGMSCLMQDMSEILYDMKWVADPYRPGMFDTQS